MYAHFRHLAEVSRLPNVDLRILPLERETSLMAIRPSYSDSVRSTRPASSATSSPRESAEIRLSIEGESDTYIFRLFFDAFVAASLSPENSRDLILEIPQRTRTR
jgi:hypothetical protein